MALKWEEPPQQRTRNNWYEILAELRSRPNTWALVQENTSAVTASAIKAGRYGGAIPGEFDARSVSNGAGKFNAYARYIGQF